MSMILLFPCTPTLSPDGIDFNSSSPDLLMFPVNSSQGDIQCITINLLNDTLLEVEENFVVELDNIDPVVTISRDADIVIVSIIDVPDPQGKRVCHSFSSESESLFVCDSLIFFPIYILTLMKYIYLSPKNLCCIDLFKLQ